MQKIPSLFKRDWEGDKSLVTSEPNPECDWVFRGEGRATQKHDGTACMITPGQKFYKRYDAKHGKTPPANFIPAQESPDPETGHWPGWVPVTNSDKYHMEAFNRDKPFASGTWELCGPKVNGNQEGFDNHILIFHGIVDLPDAPRSFNEFRPYFESHDIEGIVWHHPDGRMAKIKAKDFGVQRKRS